MTAAGRALLIFSSIAAAMGGPLALATMTTLQGMTPGAVTIRFVPTLYAKLYFPRLSALGTLMFWIALVFGSVALLQRRRIALVALRITIGIGILAFLSDQSLVLFYMLEDHRPNLIRIFTSQAIDFVLLFCAIGFLLFLGSRDVLRELARADAEPPRLPAVGSRLFFWLGAVAFALPAIFLFAGRWAYSVAQTIFHWKVWAADMLLRTFGFVRYAEWAAFLLALAVAWWTMRTPATALPTDEKKLLLVLQFALGAYASILLLRALIVAMEAVPPTEVAAMLNSFLWPAFLIVLYRARPTRMVGLALVGAFGLFWILQFASANPAIFFYSFIAWRGEMPALFLWLNIVQVMATAFLSLTSVAAAKRVLFRYAGRLPAVT